MSDLERRLLELERTVSILSRAYLDKLKEENEEEYWAIQYKFDGLLERGE